MISLEPSAAWMALPPRQRDRLKMAYQDGVSLRELAALHDLPYEFLLESLDYLNLARRRRRGEEVPRPKPMADRVLVRADLPVGAAEITKGGLLVPQQHSRPEPQQGVVTDVGQGVLLRDGRRLAPSVAPGERVLFRFSVTGRDLVVDGADHVLLPEEDILAVLEAA